MITIAFMNSQIGAGSIFFAIIAGTYFGCSTGSTIYEAPPEKTCQRHLAGLGEAITRYRAEKGCLPQTVVGPGGIKRSWRALIVPYRLQGRNYFDYRPEEPWDSPHNRRQFLRSVAGLYTCPLESQVADYPFVSYLMLLRGNSGRVDQSGHGQGSLPDEAVLVVESEGCHIEYGEPRDLDMESLFKGPSPFGVGKLNSLHPGVVKALRVDGKVIDIPKNISRDRLRALLDGKPYPVASDDATSVSALIIVGVFAVLIAWWAWRQRVRWRASKGENAGSA